MTRTDFTETFTLDSANAKLRQTADGYLVASPRIARTGIQEYSGMEVGRPDLQVVRVYRPDGEVFDKAALSSLAHKPVTIEHPNDPVTSDNWRDHAVGHVGEDIIRDGEFIRVPLVLMDAKAIAEVKSGRSQLSVGYSAVMQWADGVTDKGEPYDVKQTAIRANHVAITHTARGGPKLVMGDSHKEKTMRKILIDGISVEMEERDAQVVERRLSALEAEIAKTKTDIANVTTTAQNDVATARTETANATTLVANKDAEITTLKAQLADSTMTPQKLDQLVADRAQTVLRAKSIIGDAVVLEGKTDADIRRQVVSEKLGDAAKGWTDDMVTASFNTLTVATTGDSGDGNNLAHFANIMRNADSSGSDPRAKSYNEYETALSNRWKTAGHRTAS